MTVADDRQLAERAAGTQLAKLDVALDDAHAALADDGERVAADPSRVR
jgi:hypothetical protein